MLPPVRPRRRQVVAVPGAVRIFSGNFFKQCYKMQEDGERRRRWDLKAGGSPLRLGVKHLCACIWMWKWFSCKQRGLMDTSCPPVVVGHYYIFSLNWLIIKFRYMQS